MSGRARLALCAAVATLCAAGALLPLVDPISWMFEAAMLLGLMTGVGAAARRVPLARTADHRRAGPVRRAAADPAVRPAGRRSSDCCRARTPSTEFGRLLQRRHAGRRPVRHPRPRHPRHPAAADRRGAGDRPDSGRARGHVPQRRARRAAAARALFGGRGAVAGRCGLAVFLVAAAGYLLLLLAEGRDRLSQWGRVFGGRAPERTGRTADGDAAGPTGGRPAPVRTGRRIGAVALGIAAGGARRAALPRRRAAGRGPAAVRAPAAAAARSPR